MKAIELGGAIWRNLDNSQVDLETMTMPAESLSLDLSEAEALLVQLSGVFFPSIVPGSSISDEQRLDLASRYRILVEQIPAVVFLASLEEGTGEAYVSPQIEEMLGFTQEEWLNDPVRWYQQIHPDDKRRWSIEAAQVFLTGEPLSSAYRVLARDGREVSFQCEVRMVRRADGRPWFIHGVGFNVTELKRTEKALRASEEMLRGLFEFAPDTVVVINHSGRIERVNNQVERLFGYRPGELFGEPVEVLLPERFRARHSAFRADYLANPHPREMGAGLELFGRRKDGSEFPVDIMLGPMRTAAGSLVIAVIRDITARKRAAEALKRREEELRALTANLLSVQDEERRRIARELHDGTAQNLASLAMNLSLLLNSPAALSDANLRRLLADSLALTEQCSGEVRNLSYLLHPPLLDDLGLASALKSFIAGFCRRTGIDISLDLPPHLGRLAPEVELALFRVVQEGLANVHRHSGSPRAAIRMALSESEVRLEVEDEGSGYGSATNEETGGDGMRLGVGIPGMRERAQQLGGRMNFRSGPGGATVVVILPLRS